jgi:hypothetical protein
MGRIVLVGAQQPEPRYNWRDQLDDADAIIAALKEPRPMAIGSRRKKPSPGLNLSAHRDSLARMLAALKESYELAYADFSMHSALDKPHRELEKNWKDEGSAELQQAYDSVAEESVWDWDWDKHWVDTYWRDGGNPGKNRLGARRDGQPRPPIEPLRLVYPQIVRWWISTTQKSFSPVFSRGHIGQENAEPFDRNNPAARYLILVAQELDPRFDIRNIRALPRTIKKQRRKNRMSTSE